MILGAVLIILGVVFLLKDLGLISLTTGFWSLFWPAILVVIGLYVVLAEVRIRRFKNSLAGRILRRIISRRKNNGEKRGSL